jgi:hypothetical protein
MQKHPYLHPLYMLEGVKSEKGSRLLEDMLSVRVQYWKNVSPAIARLSPHIAQQL